MKNFFYRFRFLIIVIGFLIILFISYQNYRNVETIIHSKYKANHTLVENSILYTIQYAGTTYQLLEDQANDKLEKYSKIILAYYQHNSDPHQWELNEIRSQLINCEISVLDSNMKLIKTSNDAAPSLILDNYSSIPELLKTSLEKNKLDQLLVKTLNLPDKNSRLKKYRYLLTPDHQYLLELSIDISNRHYLFNNNDIYTLTNRLSEENEIIESIKLLNFSPSGNIIGKIESLPQQILTNNDFSTNIKSYIGDKMLTRQTLEFKDKGLNTNNNKTFKFIPYLNYRKDGSVNWWNSYIVQIIYSDKTFSAELINQQKYFFYNVLLITLIFVILVLVTAYLFQRTNQDRKKLETVINRTSEGYCMLDLDLKIMEINNSLSTMTAYPEDELIGKKFNELLDEENSALFNELLEDNKIHHRYERVLLKKDKGSIHVVINATAVHHQDQKLAYIFAFINDISERKRNEEYINHIAHHDSLTGLPNRLAFEKELKQTLRAARKNQTKLALMFLDLNNFKNVNDTYGHVTGDRLLKQVAYKLEKSLRKKDIISRLGGDEFTILLPNIESREDAIKVSIKILNTFQKPFIINNRHFYVKPSIGISLFPDDGIDPEKLVKKADQAMYQAKSGKKNYKIFGQDIS